MITASTLALWIALSVEATPADAGSPELQTPTPQEAMQRQIDLLNHKLDQLAAQTPPVASRHGFLEHKAGDAVTFYTPGGEISVYGYLDVSFDAATKGLAGKAGPEGDAPVGSLGWQPAISTNLSYVGIRGFQTFEPLPFSFIYQLETQLDIAATSGAGETNATQGNVVKGALTSRNSYLGLGTKSWGALKVGKTDAPYKTSTARLNPFSGMQGDYQVIMGNTGGDNRVEFGTRLDHSIWYESPTVAGLSLAVLFSPGQNRASNSDNIASGESDCTGGNIPGSGGLFPTCNDGSFSDAFSASLSYSHGPLFLTAAYERHFKVNRSSDVGFYADPSTADLNTTLGKLDVADEDAAKLGVQLALPTGTTVGAIVETLHRYVPAALSFQNERQRLGSWVVLSQQLGASDSMHLGWAHAFKTPGDPGQHDSASQTPPGGVAGVDYAGSSAHNSAEMVTMMYRHHFSESFSAYFDFALTANGAGAHFDLGAGGRAVTTDCHDAFSEDGSGGGVNASNPHCWTGATLMGGSVGAAWKF